jgi:hypothetical protein
MFGCAKVFEIAQLSSSSRTRQVFFAAAVTHRIVAREHSLKFPARRGDEALRRYAELA